MQHFLSADDLTAGGIQTILDRAEEADELSVTNTQGRFAANLFFEPSTRTKTSFLVAEKKLGMEPLDLQMETSSLAKGETLYDTARAYEAIGADLLVIRHSQDTWYEQLAGNVSIPIINAGSGKKDHPTQCMLDLVTMRQEFGTLKDLHVVIAGDIKHSRVAHSHARMLQTAGAHVYFASAPGFQDETLEIPHVPVDEACEMCDVLMLLRIQHERHETALHNTTSYLADYGLTMERERKMQDHAIILHPAPVNRGVEMDTRLVECDRSRIFKQMANGVPVRMALIEWLLEEWQKGADSYALSF